MKFLASSKLSEHRYKTPEGYLVCVDSILSRTGKQTYTRDELFKDGSNVEVEVDRLPNEVFNEKTLASFENKPLTIEHPDEDITPTNHNKYSVGFVRDIKKGTDSGQDVMLGTIVITDAEAIELVESGKLKDLSCGYDCDIEDEDNPQQRNIRGNHIALCEHGRAGIARIVDSIKDFMNENDDVYVNVGGSGIYHHAKLISKTGDGAFNECVVKDLVTGKTIKTIMNRLRPFVKDSIKDAVYEVCYIDDDKVCIRINANNETDARVKFRNKYGMYHIDYIRKMEDSVKDMKVSHDNFREQPIYILQSNVDKNLYFYIGKTHAMKEGDYSYAQYDLEDTTPEELLKDLEANGWHKVSRGPAPFIDEDPYIKSTEGLKKEEKKMKKSIFNNVDEKDCEDCTTKDAEDDTLWKVYLTGATDVNNIMYVKAKTSTEAERIARQNTDEDVIKIVEYGTTPLSKIDKERILKNPNRYFDSIDTSDNLDGIKEKKMKRSIFNDEQTIVIHRTKSLKAADRYHDSKSSDIVHVVRAISKLRDDRFSPSTYRALKELGVGPNQWKNWTQEQASNYIRQRRQKAGTEKGKEKTGQIKSVKNASAMEAELRKALNNGDIEFLDEGYDDDGRDVAMFGDGRKATAQKIAKYLSSKGYSGVNIDSNDGDYFATVHE